VRLASEELRVRSGAASIAVVGIRLGATLALKVASTAAIDRVVSWGGYARGSAFASSAMQFYKLHKRMEPKGFSGGPPSREEGEEAFGFLLTHATLSDLKALDVRTTEGELPRQLRRALLIGDGSGRAEQEMLETHLRSLDVAVDTQSIPNCLQFLVEIPHKSRLATPAIDAIVSWLSATHPKGEPTRLVETHPRVEPTQASAEEEPVVFGRRRRLIGIYHHSTADGGAPRLPPIVLASAGTVHRIGPHRFYVTLARRWAKMGFSVLRVDLSGIGDSPPGDDGVENVTYPRDGYDDLSEAMDYITARTDDRRFILAGLCSGGDFAFQMGMRDPRVIGSLIMNPRTFCVNDLAKVETGNFESVIAAASQALRGSENGEPVPQSLRRMVERGVDTFLVVSEEDPGVHYVDTHWGDAMKALRELPNFHREDIAGADHNFTSIWAQETVSDLVAAHLTQRYLK
jgi:dienelactone hydrolase